jgi:predicted RNase H-like nuclease
MYRRRAELRPVHSSGRWSIHRLVGEAAGRISDRCAGARGSRRLLGDTGPDIVTVDIPISTVTITGRRQADDLVSKEFGGRGCGTHSPSASRPGPIGRTLSTGSALGLPVAVTTTGAVAPALVEVYPHPALLVLVNSAYRVPYKISRARGYWSTLTPAERRHRLVRQRCSHWRQRSG